MYIMRPYISILIPLYNGIEFLKECIDSVIAQTYGDWEAIIGINGHGDDGGDVAASAKLIAKVDTRIRVIVQKKDIDNKVKSMNNMMEYAEGEWISILDCDDKWEPTKLEEQMVARYGVAKNAGVIGTLCRYFGERTDSPAIPSGMLNTHELVHYNMIINSSALVHRSLCNWRYIDINPGMDDYEMWLRIALSGCKMYNVPKILTHHRLHKASSFNSKSQNPRDLQIAFLEGLKNKLAWVS